VPAEYVPTADQRTLVENASAIGITQAEIANQLKIDEKTLRKHFRDELSSGKFKIDMTAGKTLVELMKSRDERVRLDAAKYHTVRRMGWKETNVNEQVAVMLLSRAMPMLHNGTARRDRRNRKQCRRCVLEPCALQRRVSWQT
jgi:hypothetical protein